jgi:hypothetical protein
MHVLHNRHLSANVTRFLHREEETKWKKTRKFFIVQQTLMRRPTDLDTKNKTDLKDRPQSTQAPGLIAPHSTDSASITTNMATRIYIRTKFNWKYG